MNFIPYLFIREFDGSRTQIESYYPLLFLLENLTHVTFLQHQLGLLPIDAIELMVMNIFGIPRNNINEFSILEQNVLPNSTFFVVHFRCAESHPPIPMENRERVGLLQLEIFLNPVGIIVVVSTGIILLDL